MGEVIRLHKINTKYYIMKLNYFIHTFLSIFETSDYSGVSLKNAFAKLHNIVNEIIVELHIYDQLKSSSSQIRYAYRARLYCTSLS